MSRTIGWIDPAAKVKEVNQEQAEEPAPVLAEEPAPVLAEEPEAVEEAKEEEKPAKKAATKKK